jgi:Tol biopolymer transport system component
LNKLLRAFLLFLLFSLAAGVAGCGGTQQTAPTAGGGGGSGGGGSGGGGSAGPNVVYLSWTSGTGFGPYYYQIKLMSSTGVRPVGTPDTWMSVHLSPDGKKIAFSKMVFSSNAWTLQVGVMNDDGSGQAILTNPKPGPIGQSLYPVFTPDGGKILYQYLSGPALYNNWSLVVMNADGTNRVNLTNQNETSFWSPVISPDGKTIAVVVNRDSGGYSGNLATMNIDGSGFKVITEEGGFSWPTFSADGSKIFVTYNNSTSSGFNIDVINLDGTNETALTTSNYDQCPIVAGNKVLFMSTRDSQTHVSSDYEIYDMNLDGSGITRLTNNTVYDGFYGFLPF